MRAEDLQVWTRAVPFIPFRLVTNSGRVYEIRHPEMIRVGRTTAFVFFPDDPAIPFERVEMISLVLIERAEPVHPAVGTTQPAPGSANPEWPQSLLGLLTFCKVCFSPRRTTVRTFTVHRGGRPGRFQGGAEDWLPGHSCGILRVVYGPTPSWRS